MRRNICAGDSLGKANATKPQKYGQKRGSNANEIKKAVKGQRYNTHQKPNWNATQKGSQNLKNVVSQEREECITLQTS